MNHDSFDSNRQTRRAARLQRRSELRQFLRSRHRFGTLDSRPFGAISARLVIGLLVIALGAIYLVGNLGIIDTTAPIRYFWPAAFVAVGAALMISHRSGANRGWGIVWLVAGLWSLAYQARWIDVDIWAIAFPLLLVLVGARLVQRSLSPSVDNPDTSSEAQSRIFALLSGSQSRTFTQAVKDAEVVSILSGVKLDLTQAQMDGDRATLQVTAMMGGIEIYAPSEWTIVSEVTPILGAYVDKRRPSTTVGTKTLFITGIVIMGGVEVKN